MSDLRNAVALMKLLSRPPAATRISRVLRPESVQFPQDLLGRKVRGHLFEIVTNHLIERRPAKRCELRARTSVSASIESVTFMRT
jgi:hypothetical protein